MWLMILFDLSSISSNQFECILETFMIVSIELENIERINFGTRKCLKAFRRLLWEGYRGHTLRFFVKSLIWKINFCPKAKYKWFTRRMLLTIGHKLNHLLFNVRIAAFCQVLPTLPDGYSKLSSSFDLWNDIRCIGPLLYSFYFFIRFAVLFLLALHSVCP